MAKENYPNVIFCGRLGEYKYYDMDDTVAAAMELDSSFRWKMLVS